nr:unnamed protein product [uncultured bacterium]
MKKKIRLSKSKYYEIMIVMAFAKNIALVMVDILSH